MIHRCWDRNDIKGAINALARMSDHAVSILFLSLVGFPLLYLLVIFFLLLIPNFCIMIQVTADIISLLTEKLDTITLDICSCLLPLLTSLLNSDMDRYVTPWIFINNTSLSLSLHTTHIYTKNKRKTAFFCW